MKKKLAIISTHPIQYYAPVFRALAQSAMVEPRVFYTWSQTAHGPLFDPGFGKHLSWDVPLLDGYGYEFVENVAQRPGSEHFQGIRNPGLIAAIERWGADAVLVYGWNLHSHLQALRHFKGRRPVLFRGDSTLLNGGPPLRRLARRCFLTWIYRYVDMAIAVGQNNRDYFAWCGLPPQRIGFAPHAIDTRRFADPLGTHRARARAWRQELGIPEQAPVLLYAGKLIREKDPQLLLQAFIDSTTAKIAAHGSMGTARLAEAHLLMVGNGPLETELRSLAQDCARVHFLPFQNQQTMPAVYRLGDVFILPSRSETWGLAINEAMASGLPVIAGSQVGAARDLIASNNGWIFESGQRQALVAVLAQALSCEPAVLQAMGAAGLRASAAWSIESCAQHIERIVTDSLHAKSSDGVRQPLSVAVKE